MEELSVMDINEVSGGNAALAGMSLALGVVGAFNSLTEFGEGLGYGLYDALHK